MAAEGNAEDAQSNAELDVDPLRDEARAALASLHGLLLSKPWYPEVEGWKVYTNPTNGRPVMRGPDGLVTFLG